MNISHLFYLLTLNSPSCERHWLLRKLQSILADSARPLRPQKVFLQPAFRRVIQLEQLEGYLAESLSREETWYPNRFLYHRVQHGVAALFLHDSKSL